MRSQQTTGHRGAGGTALLIALALTAATAGSEPTPLSNAEVEQAIHLSEQQAATYLTALGIVDNVIPKKRYLVAVQAAEPAQKGSVARLAVITQFQYVHRGPGVTIRTTVDLGTKKVLTREALTNYPTPLSDAELQEARKLARQQVKEVAALEEAGKKGVKVSALVTIIANERDEAYGHRVAHLFFEREGRSLLPSSVIVDLTANTARLGSR